MKQFLMLRNDAISKIQEAEEGAAAVEYGLIVGLIAVGIIAVVGALGDNLVDLFTEAKTELATTSGYTAP